MQINSSFPFIKTVSFEFGTQWQQNESDSAGRAVTHMLPALHPVLHDMFMCAPVEGGRLPPVCCP